MPINGGVLFQIPPRMPISVRVPRFAQICTREKVMVPEKFVVTFKPGQVTQERVEKEGRRAAARDGAGQDGL